MSAIRNKFLSRLHCIKKEHGWSDDEYRDILFARTGHRSASDLDDAALAKLVAQIGEQKPQGGFRRDPEWVFIDKAPKDRQPLLRKICAVCRAMKVGKAYAEGAARRANAIPEGVIVRLELLAHGQLWITAAALSRTQRWGGPEAAELQQRAATAAQCAAKEQGEKL